MKLKYLILLFIGFYLAGCSSYSELEPDPELLASEQGYLPVKDGDENFEIAQGDKYFIKFPGTAQNRFYLVLSSPIHDAIESFLTYSFDDGEGTMEKVPTEPGMPDSLHVYSVESGKPFYYWVVDGVSRDILFPLNYRYVPIWRFRFEGKYSEYLDILDRNTVDRSWYNGINSGFNFSSVDYDMQLALLQGKTNLLRTMQEELIDLESIFPPNIANSNDEGYINYSNLKNDVETELGFQHNYELLLLTFKAIQESEYDAGVLISSADIILEFLQNRNYYRPEIVNLTLDKLEQRFSGIVAYLDGVIKNKNDIAPFDFSPPIDVLQEVYELTVPNVPIEFTTVAEFIKRFNKEAQQLEEVAKIQKDIDEKFEETGSWPSNSFYPNIIPIAKDMENALPYSETRRFNKYGNYTCSIMLDREIVENTKEVTNLQFGYRKASQLVPEINTLKAQGNYQEIVRVLDRNRTLGFLLDQYPDVDERSLNQQVQLIASNIRSNNFSTAEVHLRNLHNDETFLNFNAIRSSKDRKVRDYENEMFQKVKIASKSGVDSFIAANETNITNVEGIYQDSAFHPVYTLTFASGGQQQLLQRRAEIQDYLDKMKYHEFPENAINTLYKDFVGNINDRGVDKARAIAIHGKYYRGNNSSVKNKATECNVNVAKWITKPKEYRKLYALPITTNRNGTNTYMFRLEIQIPSDARFPVFDVNIKLPADVAQNAGQTRWYDIITLNNVEVKNEGRVKITSPLPSNNYECQISPVQMEKEGSNILEVKFTYPGYKVFEVSVMAQKPIIKKN